tara:strand:+ start:2306 stop:4012 length:1707 start_codon:yes stop_codon:yes gene_type:complete
MPLPLFEIKIAGKPIAIIKSGDRQLQFVKVNKFHSKYFATKDGIFEIDDEYSYLYGKTSIYFYNFSNNKPISLLGVNEVSEKLKGVGDSELFNRDRFLASLGPNTDTTKIALPPDRTTELSAKTKHFVQDYATDDEAAKTDVMVHVHSQKAAIPAKSSNLLGFGANRGDYAFVQIAHKKLDICPMVLHDDRAYTKYGVFEATRDNVYMFKKQVVCFFVLSDSEEKTILPMPKKADKIRKQMLRIAKKSESSGPTEKGKKKWKFLETFHTPRKPNLPPTEPEPAKSTEKIKIPGTTASTPDLKTGKTARPEIYKGPKIKLPKNISLSTEKSLIQYQADSPSIYRTTINELHLSKQAVATKLSDPLKKAIPIVVIFGAVMGLAIVMSNAPPVIDKMAEYAGIQPPQIVLLTPDEARDRGLDVSVLETAPEGFEICHDQHTGQQITCPEPVVTEETTETTETTESDVGTADVIVPVVEDTIAPTMVIPSDMEIQSDNDRGAKVTFIVQAIDETDGSLEVFCDPPSGKIFPIGSTDVICVATDESGNSGYGTFTVTVLPQTNEGPGFNILPP